MELYYLSKYPIRLCREYIKHFNVYDRFIYTWEEREDYYFITFREYQNSTRSLATTPKPTFKVEFEDLGEQTGIRVQFICTYSFIKIPMINTREIDKFWEKKLDAEKIRVR